MSAIVVLVYAAAVVAVAAWLVAAATAVALARRRAAGVTLGWLAFNGIRWFDAATFRPDAAPLHRRFVGAVIAFFAAILATVLLVALA